MLDEAAVMAIEFIWKWVSFIDGMIAKIWTVFASNSSNCLSLVRKQSGNCYEN